MTKEIKLEKTLWQGLKYAKDKAEKRKEKIYSRIKVEDLEDPIIQRGVGQIIDSIQTEEKSERECFNNLI